VIPRRSLALRSLVAPVALLALAACARDSAPTAAPSFSATHGAGAARGRHLVTSGERYSDRGSHRSRGRSGSAAIAAEAVFGADGTTALSVTPYRVSDVNLLTPLGCVEKVQLKAFDAAGRPLWTRNYPNLGLASGASFTAVFPALLPGTTLQVQANVKCIDARRTNVVTVTFAVVRRTDPAVVGLTVPSQAALNLPTLVLAQVRELNGGQGATGTCYLTVDGVLADSIVRVWVDAGGTVDCAFAPTFGTVGTHEVRVDFAHVVPQDDDLSNNSRSATLEVVSPPPPPPPGTLDPFMITAIVRDDTVNVADLYYYSMRLASDPSVLRDTLYSYFSRTGNEQFAGFNGIIYKSVPFPLARFVVSQSSGSTRYDTLDLAGVPPIGGSSSGATCADMSQGVMYRLVCSYDPDPLLTYGRTSIIYQRSASNAAYVSQWYYVHYKGGVPSGCDARSTDTSANCYYLTGALGAPLVPYGSSYTFNVVLETPTRRYSSHVTIPLESAPIPIAVPFHCSDLTLTGGDGIAVLFHACASTTGTLTRRAGDLPLLVGLTEALAP
jgi:hypothetical protein